MDYVNEFNHLSQYAGTHVGTDEKKRDRFYCGLSCILQKELCTRTIETNVRLMIDRAPVEQPVPSKYGGG